MARRARLQFPGIPLHITQRGNNRQACFRTGNDRLVFLGLLEELLAPARCSLHAYVLMTNHVHLLLTPELASSASLLMKRLGQEYAQYVNRTHRRTGSLWDGRFHSSVVDTDEYLLRCYRYVELNPVRAGMVPGPADYPWSSFGANALGRPSTLIRPHDRYLALAPTPEARARAYHGLFEQALTQSQVDEIRRAVRGGLALGGDRFRDRIYELAGRPVSRRRWARKASDPLVSGPRGLSPY